MNKIIIYDIISIVGYISYIKCSGNESNVVNISINDVYYNYQNNYNARYQYTDGEMINVHCYIMNIEEEDEITRSDFKMVFNVRGENLVETFYIDDKNLDMKITLISGLENPYIECGNKSIIKRIELSTSPTNHQNSKGISNGVRAGLLINNNMYSYFKDIDLTYSYGFYQEKDIEIQLILNSEEKRYVKCSYVLCRWVNNDSICINLESIVSLKIINATEEITNSSISCTEIKTQAKLIYTRVHFELDEFDPSPHNIDESNILELFKNHIYYKPVNVYNITIFDIMRVTSLLCFPDFTTITEHKGYYNLSNSKSTKYSYIYKSIYSVETSISSSHPGCLEQRIDTFEWIYLNKASSPYIARKLNKKHGRWIDTTEHYVDVNAISFNANIVVKINKNELMELATSCDDTDIKGLKCTNVLLCLKPNSNYLIIFYIFSEENNQLQMEFKSNATCGEGILEYDGIPKAVEKQMTITPQNNEVTYSITCSGITKVTTLKLLRKSDQRKNGGSNNSSSQRADNGGPFIEIVGGSCGGALVIILIIIVLITTGCCRKKKRKTFVEYKTTDDQEGRGGGSSNEEVFTNPRRGSGHCSENLANVGASITDFENSDHYYLTPKPPPPPVYNPGNSIVQDLESSTKAQLTDRQDNEVYDYVYAFRMRKGSSVKTKSRIAKRKSSLKWNLPKTSKVPLSIRYGGQRNQQIQKVINDEETNNIIYSNLEAFRAIQPNGCDGPPVNRQTKRKRQSNQTNWLPPKTNCQSQNNKQESQTHHNPNNVHGHKRKHQTKHNQHSKSISHQATNLHTHTNQCPQTNRHDIKAQNMPQANWKPENCIVDSQSHHLPPKNRHWHKNHKSQSNTHESQIDSEATSEHQQKPRGSQVNKIPIKSQNHHRHGPEIIQQEEGGSQNHEQWNWLVSEAREHFNKFK